MGPNRSTQVSKARPGPPVQNSPGASDWGSRRKFMSAGSPQGPLSLSALPQSTLTSIRSHVMILRASFRPVVGQPDCTDFASLQICSEPLWQLLARPSNPASTPKVIWIGTTMPSRQCSRRLPKRVSSQDTGLFSNHNIASFLGALQSVKGTADITVAGLADATGPIGKEIGVLYKFVEGSVDVVNANSIGNTSKVASGLVSTVGSMMRTRPFATHPSLPQESGQEPMHYKTETQPRRSRAAWMF